jgi:Ca2+-transporting ATPase
METGGTDDTVSRAYAECDAASACASLGTGPEGLSSAEAARRLNEKGPNLLPAQRKQLLRQKLLVQFRNLFNVLLLVAAALSFIAGYTSNDPTSVNMGLAIVGAVVVSVLFAIAQERRAERAVEAIGELVPMNAKVMREGQLKPVPVADIVPGDILSLEEGDRVPADARVVKGYEISVDNSTLTGESEPQPRTASPEPAVPGATVVTCSNMVFAGTTVVSGSGMAVVTATGAGTVFGRAVAMTAQAEEPLSPLQRELDRTAKLNFALAFVVGFLFLLIARVVIGLELGPSLMFMIGVMVSLVPEGLQVTVTLALALSSLAMARRNVVVKRLSAVETLGSTTVICTDKTGTVTEGQMTVRYLWMGGQVFQVTGEGYEPEGAVLLEGQKLLAADMDDLRRLCEVAALDNNSTLVPPLDRRKTRWTAVGDSTDAALLVLAAKAGMQPKQAQTDRPRVGMIPFESARKMMTSVHRDRTGGLTACVKGAPHELAARCTRALWKGNVVPISEDLAALIAAQIDRFAREAYRVLALAYRDLPAETAKFESEQIERELTFIGLVAILDPPRAGTQEAVRKARMAGVRIVMLTGDHKLTAEAIARKVGILTSANGAVLTGDELAALDDDSLSKVLEKPELVFARIAPEQKLRVVRALRARGETVAVTGDGVNDAPALLEADIGISMGIAGTDVARESSDMVLMDDNFASIVNGIEEGRSVFDNLRKFIVYVYAHNWAELLAFIAFVLLGTPLPLAVVQVLAIDLIMEIPPSLSLTVEPPEPGIMERPPRSRRSRLFDLAALGRSAYIGVLIGAAALLLCFQTWSQGGWHLGMSAIKDTGLYVKGTTVFMAAVMAGQLGTLFATRTNVRSAFSVSPLRNRWLLAAVLAETVILLAVVYVPALQALFSAGALAPVDWLYIYSFFPVIILLEEGRKLLLRRFVLPAPAVPPAPPAAIAEAEPAPGATARPGPFVELAPPVLLALFMRPGEDSAVRFSLKLGKQAGSRVVMMPPGSAGRLDRSMDGLRSRVEALVSGGMPAEQIEVRLSGAALQPEAIVSALSSVIRETNAETVVVPVGRDVLSGGKRKLARIAWAGRFTDRRVVLVSGPERAGAGPADRPLRILIPVLSEVRPGPFELAASLTAGSVIPDVDVVAARVIEMPRQAPLYSIYRRDTLAIGDDQLRSIRSGLSRPLRKLIHPVVLLVRNIGGDIARFAGERQVDLIILEGGRAADGSLVLTKEERDIIARAGCTVAVVIPREARAERTSVRAKP